MNVAGIDCGAKNIRVLIMSEGKILAKSSMSSIFDQTNTAETAFGLALKKVDLQKKDISHITATGSGKEEIACAHSTITEVRAAAKACHRLVPEARTLIDVGAEEGRAIRIDYKGKVIDFAINDKCAAGAGTFIDTMALALEVKMEEMGPLSLRSKKEVSMKAHCAVFAESEVISLIHDNYSKADIARAVHDAIAGRIASMARKVGLERELAVVGGISRNIGFVESLRRALQMDLLIPENPEFSCAYGAALVAADLAKCE